MNTNQQTVLLDSPKEVDVIAIERELTTLWKEASDGTSDEGSAPVIRACSLNFIVVTEYGDTLDALSQMVGDVTLEHPARIFLIAANRQGIPKLDAFISARCSLPVPGGKQVCCEQISITADGTETNKIPSIVTSLLVPDVPSVLLWKVRIDANDTVLQSLANVVGRILIDSSEDVTPERSLLEWQTFVRQQNSHVTFGDLAWTHLVAWRSLVASVFNAHDMRQHLPTLDAVTIEYSSTQRPKHSGLSQALLLVGWFAQKVKWKNIEPLRRNSTEEYSAKFHLDEQVIHIRIVSAPSRKNLPGAIESVELHMREGIGVKFTTTEYRDCIRSTREHNGTSADALLSVLNDKSEAQLVAQELEVMSRDIGYEAALKTLTESFGGRR